MNDADKQSVEWLLEQMHQQSQREIDLNDVLLSNHEKHCAVSAGLAGTMQSLNSNLPELLVGANPTLPTNSGTN